MELIERIERELEELKVQNVPDDTIDRFEDIYQTGVISGICKALSIVYGIHIEYIGK